MLTLITGGARSGKSSFAQSLCKEAAAVVYLATATKSDAEMCARIARHRQDRPSHWKTIEEPLAVPEAVERNLSHTDLMVIDCLTLWVSNLSFEWRGNAPEELQDKVCEVTEALIESTRSGHVLAVTNEVGWSIVPEDPVGRFFRDLQGIVNQRIAQAADTVYLMVAGIPLRIK